ncbi:DUF805 domain-containing protein [Sphingomonas radiodurans]|uniref:DUF805 domain-containing protein n=1 Tax=Sphingomonas radiodurans TaxID=2890321 RepID=UPI001E5ADA91|nr:DUF805 domain-containing protein [Sphingomonas radiodurans]WBH15284.1 DUF805 domain-containing protein [Sphingomonas radiodurans]
MVDHNALKNIEELHRLKTEGVITEDDYEKAKERILFGAKAPAAGSGLASFMPAASPVPRPADDDHFGWITLPLKRYADFKGRSSRKEFWMFQLVFVAIGVIAMIGGVDLLAGTGGLGGLTLLLTWLALIALIVPLLAVQVRRLHDQDRSGWLAAFNLLPYVGALVVYILMLMEGTPGDNQYGPDPRSTDTMDHHVGT